MILDLLRRTIERHALVAPGGRVLVALSGGPDSVALLHLMLALQEAGDLRVAGVAHFNHQLRGDDADRDESFCRELAASLAVPIEVAAANVREAARATRCSLEDAARTLRYAFLEAAADRLNADVIAVGHSLDDQAETFLLRLIRGAGPRGLGSIYPRAGRVIRPLIEIPRADLRQYAEDHRLRWREDETNRDLSIPRNRVRHELLPYLEREFSRGIVEVLARDAAIAREDEDLLQREAIDLASTIVLRNTGGTIEVAVDALRALHPALQARVARHALAMGVGAGPTEPFFGFDQVQRLLDLAKDERERDSVSFPGRQVERRGNRIIIGPALSRELEQPNSFRVPLSIPGEVLLDRQGWAVSAERAETAGPAAAPGSGRSAAVAVAAAPLSLPLAVRSRRPGDRFRPLGQSGRKKLQDFLVDRKIPREIRDSLPLVVDGDDRIVWVVGQSVAEDFRVTEPSRGVILLKARRLGGLG
jgi:tRNA(Ile)-lysidine synthase